MLSPEELRPFVGLLPTDDTDDGLLESLERAAVADFERKTNRYVGPVDELVDTLSGGRRWRWSDDTPRIGPSPRGVISLRLRAPVVSLTSVEVWTGNSWDGTSYPISSFTVLSDGTGIMLSDGSALPGGRDNVRVTYQGGYASGEEPADIRDEIANRVAQAYRRRASASPVVLEPGQQVLQPGGTRSNRAAGYYRNPGL